MSHTAVFAGPEAEIRSLRDFALDLAQSEGVEVGLPTGLRRIVSEVVIAPANGLASFFLAPDGAKEGSPVAEAAAAVREVTMLEASSRKLRGWLV